MDQLKPTSANSCPLTPLTFLHRAATVYGDCPSILYNHKSYTWTDTHSRCLQLSSSISNLGIRRGHVVSVLAPNVPAMYELQFAVPMAGAVLNNINTRLDSRTISVLLRHSESKLVFVDSHYSSLLLAAVARFPAGVRRPTLVLIRDDVAAPAPAPPPTSVEFYSTYEDLVYRGDCGFEWVRPVNEWDPMTLNYTSGTTSSPKGVVR